MKLFQFFYNLFFPVAFVVILPSYLPRMFKRGGYKDQFLQRLGIFDAATKARIGKGHIWVHAVSVGEILIALKFIHRWKEKNPEVRFLLSTTTTTALAIAKKNASDWLEPIANPIDFFWITNRIIDEFEPAALIMIEGDVWPQRLFYCKKKNIPTAIVTARLSPRSEARLKRFRWIVQRFFNQLDFITVPSIQDQDRWLSLGVDAARLKISGNMKYDQQGVIIAQPPADADEVFANLGWKKSDPIFLAGSTHNLEEEEILLKSWLALRKKFPSLRFIIAPRHVERRNELLSLFEKSKVPVALRSEKSKLLAEVLILDTTGELNQWYTVATFVFIGKSLGIGGASGGQNPVEPLVLKKPVLVGPSMENFEPLISELRQAQGLIEVHHEVDIVKAAENFLLHHEEAAASVVERGLQTLRAHQGSIDRTYHYAKKLLLLLALLCATCLLQAQSEEERTSSLMSGKGFPKAASPEEKNAREVTASSHRPFDEEVSSNETLPVRGSAAAGIAEKPAVSFSREDKLEEIKSEMRGFIETTATLHTATDLFQRTEEVRTLLQNKHPDIDWNSEEAIDSFIKKTLFNRYQQDLAIDVLLAKEQHQDDIDWASLEKSVTMEKEQIERDLVKARREVAEAKAINEGMKKKNVFIDALYDEACCDQASMNEEAKKFSEKFMEARLETLYAKLKAIKVRNSSQSQQAEAELAAAKILENYACDAAEASQIGVAATMLWCELCAKKNSLKADSSEVADFDFALAWSEIVQRTVEAISRWEKLAEGVPRYLDQVAPEDRLLWISNLEEAQHQKMNWKVMLLSWENRKKAMDTMALKKYVQSQHSNTVWEEFIEKSLETAMGYDQLVEACQQAQDDAAIKFKTSWIEKVKAAEHQRASWNAQIIQWKVQKEELSADAIWKRSIVIPSDQLLQSKDIFEEVHLKAKQAEKEWAEMAQIYQRGLFQAIEQSRNWWREEFENAENQRATWAARIFYCEASKAAISFVDAQVKAMNAASDTTEKIALWNEAIAKSKEVKQKRQEAVIISESNLIKAPERFKANWKLDFESVKNLMLMAETYEPWCEANKVSVLAADLETKALISPATISAELQAERWGEAKIKAEEAKGKWAQVVTLYQQGLEAAPEKERDQPPGRLKHLWNTGLETVKSQQLTWASWEDWYEANKKSVIASKSMATPALMKEPSWWNVVILQVKQAEEAWAQAAKAKRSGIEQISERLKAPWITSLETAENKQLTWATYLPWCEAKKAANIATLAKNSAENAPIDHDIALWEEAKSQAQNAEMAWNQALEAKRQGLKKTPERLQAAWITDCNTAENQQLISMTAIFWAQLTKMTTAATTAKEKAEAAPLMQQELLWRETKFKAERAEKACIQCVDACQKAFEIAPERLKEEKQKNLNAAIGSKTLWLTMPLWYEAARVGSSAQAAAKKAEASSEEQELLWEDAKLKAARAERAWAEAVKGKRQVKNLDFVPENLKLSIDLDIERAENNQKFYSIIPLWYEAKKIGALAKEVFEKAKKSDDDFTETLNFEKILALTEAGSVAEAYALVEGVKSKIIDSAEIPLLWNEAALKINQAITAWSHAVDSYQRILSQIPFRFKDEWRKQIAAAEQERTDWKYQLKNALENAANALSKNVVKDAKKANDLRQHAMTLHAHDVNFEKAWEDTLEKARAMEPSCDEALRFYNNLIEQDEQLNVSFDEVHHIKKLFSLFPSYFEAEKTQQIYDAAQEHFLEIPFKEEDISFNKIWDDLIKKSKATASAWNQVVESYLKKEVITKASGSLQAAFAELNDVVSSAKRKKALADADPLWLEAKKCDKIAEFFKQKAVAANPQDGILFETRWNDATQQMRVVEAAWDQVLQAYLDAQKKSSEEVQQKWNFHIDHALYEKMTATAQPLLLDALKKRKVATAARNQIMIVAPNDKAVLQATISNALEKAREALESWNKVVQIFYSHENSIPQEMKSKWNLLREDAQSWVSRYKLQPLLIEAYRTNAIMNVMEEELRKTASQKKVPQKSIWNSAMTQANQAKIAWENVRKAFQDAAAEIPISKKEEWGVIQQGFEHELTYIKEKMELFRNSQF